MPSQMWLSGARKGKGSLEQRIAVKGQGQMGVVQRDLFCRLLLSFVSLLEQGVGRYLLFFPVSFEFCYWVAVELIFCNQ